MSDGIERRDFLKVLGVAGAGAGLTGCSTEGAERLIPYVIPDEEIVPGLSTYYRTTCRECPAGCGMDIETMEGRAIKAEGNPLSPISHGALCARGQASLHGLYNPDRVPHALAKAVATTEIGWEELGWDTAEAQLAAAIGEAPGRKVFLTRGLTGTMEALVEQWTDAFGFEHVQYETFAREPLQQANRRLFDIDAIPTHDFSNAEVVVSFGADFIETWLSSVDYQHGYTKRHSYSDATGERGQLIAVAPHQSLTDMNADEWLPVRPGTEHLIALAMAKIVAERRGGAGAAASFLDDVDVAEVAEQADIAPAAIRRAAVAFAERGGRSLAVGPGVESTHRRATALAVAVQLLNYVAGNIGETVRFDRRENAAETGSYRQLSELVADMRAGEVGALLIAGPNPAYSLPRAEEFVAALERVPFIASFSQMMEETSQHADLLLPDHHFLESWGDHVPRTGIYSLVQPVMQPVFVTKQTGDVLLAVARRAGVELPSAATTYYEYLRERWRREIYPRVDTTEEFEDWWRKALQRGVVTFNVSEPVPALDADALSELEWEPAEFAGDEDDFYLSVYPSYRFWDGRLANRPWLQELPDPVSKTTWTSWVEVHPTVADELDLEDGSIVEIETLTASVELPVWRHPGTRPDTIGVQLGQGHDEFGRFAQDRGVNPIKLLAPEIEEPSGSLVWFQTRAAMRPTGDWELVPFGSDQQTQAGREIAEITTLAEARSEEAVEEDLPERERPEPIGEAGVAGPGPEETNVLPKVEETVRELQGYGGFGPLEVETGPGEYPPPETYYGEYTEQQPRWGMSIDMEKCTGCSACMTACRAENNIGIVGPEQVAMGRILHWIRIERYWEETEDGEFHGTRFLPMLCQHCGNAPCEPVCPVYASYHTPDGLNAQIYNRCVGTRYCANNCPYKVRYFNWFSWEWPEPLNWQLNPDVAVREKGVMEKCTFCVQRIREAQHEARLEGRGVPDGQIVPACAQTCPGEAIIFGNLDDPNSRVSRIAASGRGYRVLQDENTQPAITYLKKVVVEEDEVHEAEAGHGAGA